MLFLFINTLLKKSSAEAPEKKFINRFRNSEKI